VYLNRFSVLTTMENAKQQALAPPRHCGLTEMFKETGINSPHPCKNVDNSCAKMLNFSQSTVGGGLFAESQELGCAECLLLLPVTCLQSCPCWLKLIVHHQARSVNMLCRTQDFATPKDKRFNMPLSQASSQAAIIPALGPPPTFDAPGKRGRTVLELTPSTGECFLCLVILSVCLWHGP
jgi:hypothetical protein